MNAQTIKLPMSLTVLTPLVLGSLWMLVNKTALRDESTASPRPYSFARVQLWWWSLIILGCYIVTYGITGHTWALSSGCATLFGISALTTTAGTLIDVHDADGPDKQRHQNQKSEGFFTDILSDASGISIHRFQAAIFNMAYGVYFVIDVFSDTTKAKFPDFDAPTLALLGVSSGTYAVLKVSENSQGALKAAKARFVASLSAPTVGSSILPAAGTTLNALRGDGADSGSDELLDPVAGTDMHLVTDN
jgi:hypothetical protein